MGNTPSSPLGKDGQRLSKQKSNYSLSSGVDSPTLQPHLLRSSSTIKALPSESDAVIEYESGHRRSRPDLRQQIRAQLQSDDHSPPHSNSYGRYSDRSSDLRKSASRDRLSKSLSPDPSSNKSGYGYSSQSSLAVDPRTVDLQTAVGILEELRKTASPEDLVALRKFHISPLQ